MNMNSIEEAVDIMEPGAAVTDEQLGRLGHDAGLREACQDIMAIQALTDAPDFDASTALFRFHDRHRPAHIQHLNRYVLAALASAAILAGAIFLLRPTLRVDKSATTKSAFFTAEADLPQTTITTGTAKPVRLTAKRVHNEADPVVSAVALAPTETIEQQTIAIPCGETLQLILSDGTKVYMHPHSRLIYPSSFVGAKREVQLEGEAYFCVAHNTTQQFVVHTPHTDVCDYGTEFNVKTAGDCTEIVLVEGSASVLPHNATETLLVPGQKAVCGSLNGATGAQLLALSEVDTDAFLAWRDGYFYFDNVALGDILHALGQYYNLSVEVYQPKLLNLHLRYIIPRTYSADFAVVKLGELVNGCIRLAAGKIVVGQ